MGRSDEPMHPLQALSFNSRIAKRAQYEAFEFELLSTEILVRNGSHANPSDHEYLVTVEDGIPATCECPADTHYEGACKHRVAVAIRRPLLEAVSANQKPQPIAADGGQFEPPAPQNESNTDVDPNSNEEKPATDEGAVPTVSTTFPAGSAFEPASENSQTLCELVLCHRKGTAF
ncbi:SWIM zinc finger family protein [Halosimplex halophilum]|uniref:SWIM zinc finger family protein n=1 Tax=Halosimplex halophilum TaxID=2559572 RepID=UPI001FE4AC09|nr:SWIM zinc finger family protein [Halosimplex halophilum]